jgi:hypothetical protein
MICVCEIRIKPSRCMISALWKMQVMRVRSIADRTEKKIAPWGRV